MRPFRVRGRWFPQQLHMEPKMRPFQVRGWGFPQQLQMEPQMRPFQVRGEGRWKSLHSVQLRQELIPKRMRPFRVRGWIQLLLQSHQR